MHFEDENGKQYNEAYFDGYQFGDRQLEGVMFRAFIKDGKLKVELAKKEDEGYFKTLNTKMWLKAALEHALEEADIFSKTPDGDIELNLIQEKKSEIKTQPAGKWKPVVSRRVISKHNAKAIIDKLLE